jgi:hypothetical protein
MDIDAAPEGSHIFHIDVLGLRGMEHYLTGIHVLNLILEHLTCKPITQNQDEEANVTLIRHGLLGASPSQPTVAFTLESLEFYHQLRRCQGNFSIQAFIKALCAIQDVIFSRYMSY